MSFSKKYREEIKDFIIETIYKNGNVFKEVLEKYPISRQTVYKYIKEFIDKDIVEKESKSKYRLKFYINETKQYDNTKKDIKKVVLKLYETSARALFCLD